MSDPAASERKRAAKSYNEQLKLTATWLNNLSLAIVGAAFIVPGIVTPTIFAEGPRLVWLASALALHMAARALLRRIRSED